eukprot:10099737-Heterocapsa_arctica.AAC.1
MHLLVLSAGCFCWRFAVRELPDAAVRQDASACPEGGMLAPQRCYGRTHLLVLTAGCSCWRFGEL